MLNRNFKKFLKIFFLLSCSQINATEDCCDDYQPIPCYSVCEEQDCANRFWVDAEYLFWKVKNSPESIPLVATAPIIIDGGPVLNQPGSSVVLGGKSISHKWRSGAKFVLGYRFDNACPLSIEANYFFLPHATKKQTVFSSGSPGSSYLSVPYFDVITNLESSSPIAAPGLYRGLAELKDVNNTQGAEFNGAATFYSDCTFDLQGLLGFRYWNFKESLKFFVDSPAVTIPTEIYHVEDQFQTKNNFYAGQIGLALNYHYKDFFLNAKGKTAFGAMYEEAIIKGKFITNAFDGFGNPQTFLGGYFALPSNIGNHKRTRFAILSDINLNIGYRVTECLNINIGYTFLYVNKMLWAGKQINRNINPTQSALYEFTPTPNVVGEPQPKTSFKDDNFWAQGLNVGVEWQF